MRQRKCLRGRFMMIRSSPTSFRTRRSAGWCRCRSLPSPSGTVFVRARCVWSTHEYLKGLAVSLPPRHSDAHFLEDAGFHRLPSILGAEAHGRFTSFLDYLAPLRSRAVPGPHWYVMILGVDPRNQREGVGRSLLQEMFRRADAEVRRATSKPPSQGTYRFTRTVALPLWTTASSRAAHSPTGRFSAIPARVQRNKTVSLIAAGVTK